MYNETQNKKKTTNTTQVDLNLTPVAPNIQDSNKAAGYPLLPKGIEEDSTKNSCRTYKPCAAILLVLFGSAALARKMSMGPAAQCPEPAYLNTADTSLPSDTALLWVIRKGTKPPPYSSRTKFANASIDENFGTCTYTREVNNELETYCYDGDMKVSERDGFFGRKTGGWRKEQGNTDLCTGTPSECQFQLMGGLS